MPKSCKFRLSMLRAKPKGVGFGVFVVYPHAVRMVFALTGAFVRKSQIIHAYYFVV